MGEQILRMKDLYNEPAREKRPATRGILNVSHPKALEITRRSDFPLRRSIHGEVSGWLQSEVDAWLQSRSVV